MNKTASDSNPAIWGGLECTINRIRDTYIDQLSLSGHYSRASDIDQIASLGIKTLRFPILWEYHQPVKDKDIDWTWTEQQLGRLRSHQIEPIAGLVHHGSGPVYTSLNSGSFASGLKQYAGEVAKKFPWIKYYNPVNEPLTTSRFSGLYGLWYPHQTNDLGFATMLLNQLKGVVLAMKQIRSINPEAKLVQTEDLGKTYSTPGLAFQADFENERRWLTFDFLCGKVDSDHPLWDYFRTAGVSEKSLNFFLDNPCPPDILGLNYYVTSERFLDDDINKYPRHMHGGNGLQRYVDTEAVRVDHRQPSGLKHLLKEVQERYGLPMALTEVHLHCSREEQMRWFKEIWEDVRSLNQEGAGIVAVTAWSLQGAFGWNKLLTSPEPEYESGVFDLRAPSPRPTALAKMIKCLNTEGQYHHPLLTEKGWWHREERFLYPPSGKTNGRPAKSSGTPPLLISGKTGTLGHALGRVCDGRSINYKLLDRREFELCDLKSMESVIDKYRPWAIVNAAGFVKIDEAQTSPEKCFSANTSGPAQLAELCRKKGIKLVNFSSDQVFNGRQSHPYVESDATDPLNVYGASKAEMERSVVDTDQDSLVIRTSAFFGPWDQYNFISALIRTLRSGTPFKVMNDVRISPTYVPDLVHTVLDLLADDEKGIWHLANKGNVSWSELALEVADRAHLDKKLLESCTQQSLKMNALRPSYGVLGSEKASLMPDLGHALEHYFHEFEKDIVPAATNISCSY